MARRKHYNYYDDDFKATAVALTEEKYSNDAGGRSAYDPAILLKIILYAYSKGITSSTKVFRLSLNLFTLTVSIISTSCTVIPYDCSRLAITKLSIRPAKLRSPLCAWLRTKKTRIASAVWAIRSTIDRSVENAQMDKNDYHDYSYQGRVAGDKTYLQLTPPSPLSRWVQCFWQLNVPEGLHTYRSIPDNNVDCIFTLHNAEDNFFVLPFYSPALFQMEGPVSYFGVRFRVLAQQWLTATPVGEWGNATLVDILGAHLVHGLCESIDSGANFHNRCERAGAILLANLFYRGIDKRFENFVQYVYRHASSKTDISDKKCAQFALSARHLRRLCQLYQGLSPRNFNRVARFQKTLHLMNISHTPLAWADCYYDQPHFNREFKMLSGLTPSEFINLSVLYNATDDSA